jgi:hypothetical protein
MSNMVDCRSCTAEDGLIPVLYRCDKAVTTMQDQPFWLSFSSHIQRIINISHSGCANETATF